MLQSGGELCHLTCIRDSSDVTKNVLQWVDGGQLQELGLEAAVI